MRDCEPSRRLGGALLGDGDERAQNAGGAFEALGRGVPFVEEHDLHVRAHARAGRMLGDVGNKPTRIVENIVAEREHRAFGPDFDALDIGAPAQRLIATTCNRYSTSSGSGPKRSTSS